MIAIWDKVFFKLRVSFGGLVISKEVFSEYSHRIERHIDVVKEVLEIQSSVSFEFCLIEELIEFWLADLMFEVPHATNIFGDSSFQCWMPPVSLDRGGRVRRSQCILLVYRGFRNVVLVFLHFYQNLLECISILLDFLSSLLLVLIGRMHVGFNGGLNEKEMFIGLGIHLITPF